MLDFKLESLLSVYQEKNFTKAARKLSLTQPSVSSHIQMLERELGHTLCIRGGQEIRFTPEGELTVKAAKELKEIYRSMLEEIETDRRSLVRLKLGVTRALESDNNLAFALAQYLEKQPNSVLEIKSDTVASLYDGLKNYELDFLVIDVPPVDNTLFTSKLIATDSLECFVSSQSSLAHNPYVTLEQLKKLPLVLWLPTSTNRIIFENALNKAGENLKNFNIILETDSISTIKLLVSRDEGVSIVPRKQGQHRKKYTCIPIENMPIPREIYMVYQKDFMYKAISREFQRILKESFSHEAPR